MTLQRDTQAEDGTQVRLADGLTAQRGHLIGWVPVCLGIGIGLYFIAPTEPDVQAYGLVMALAIAACLGALVAGFAFRPLLLGVAICAFGFCLTGLRAQLVAGPVLGFRYYGPIEGRVIKVDRSASDALRLTLDRVVLSDVWDRRTPTLVRVSLSGEQGWIKLEPGMVVGLTGHLSPPGGPSEPGGFDFQRTAWFDQIGAVGYTRTPVLAMDMAPKGWSLWVGRVRLRLSAAIQSGIEGESGAFAAALTTGDRSAMGQAVIADLRGSNLAHLISISGLHMGLLAGFVFTLIRTGLALTTLGLRWNSKKIAASVALLAATAYLVLSGGDVATERSFIMISVMLVAVLLDRRAVSLRSIAIAATVILVTRPEELMGPGFQMSFAATTALVAVFAHQHQLNMSRWPAPMRFVAVLVLTSLVAGLATAPYGAAHFNQFSRLGLIANLLSVPVMGMIVMPGAVLAACLAPFGLEWIAYEFMDLGLRWILFIAHWINGIKGSVGHIVTPPTIVIPMITLGGLWVILWQGRGRWAGFAPVVLALALWPFAARPLLLVADSGSLMGLAGDQGRALSKATGDSFSAERWLENDGSGLTQQQAGALPGFTRSGRVVQGQVGDQTVALVTGKTAFGALIGCGGADVLITNQTNDQDRGCEVYDIARLRQTGALALSVAADGGVTVTTARDVSGSRLWNTPGLALMLP